MFETRVTIGMVAILAAAVYYWLLPYVIGYAFVIVPGRETLLSIIDSRVVASHMWLQLAHTLAVLVVAAPVAVFVHLMCRSRAMLVAAVVGMLVALVSLVPTLMTESIRAVLTGQYVVVLLADHAKIALMVPALVFLGRMSAR